MEKSKITLWRGVSKDHPSFQEAEQGIAKPRGGHDDPITHNLGNTQSIFTSWTREKEIAERRAKKEGIILEKDFPTDENSLETTPDIYCEEEVLVRGIVTNAKVIRL